jgi:hypothetical protein
LNVNQAAAILGFQVHDIAVLISAKLLQPLGHPAPNAPKYFASCAIERLAQDQGWLDKASQKISERWRMKNGRRRGISDRLTSSSRIT